MNKNLIPQETALVFNKLSKILDNLSKDREETPIQTQEALIAEAAKLINLFYKSIKDPRFKPVTVFSLSNPVIEDYNDNFQQISDDIEILFAEFENIEAVILNQFNLITTQTNRINARIKRLSSSVTDYYLYSKLPVNNSLFFSDSFTDSSKVEVGSSLLNGPECFLNQSEGIVLLPIDTSATKTIDVTASVLINSNSNGRAGNNEEIGALLVNDDPDLINDNNADTWFEYERVAKEDDGIPLILDFVLNLSKDQGINYIRIDPNNFGTKTEIEILDISTSSDGILYKSIKDEFAITGLIVEDEKNIFKLSPSTSKYAGQGIFTFTPRFAKYVKIQLKQSSPYIIQTTQGPQFRYAIGLKNVEIQAQAYKGSGEIVSSVFATDSDIRKVTVYTTQVPLPGSELTEIKHQVSLDDGNSWIDISPIANNSNFSNSVAEVVNINSADSNSITISNEPKSIRYKAILSRHDEKFTENSSSFAELIKHTSEIKSVPLLEPWSLPLEKPPLLGSITLLDPSFGSRGRENSKYIVGIGTGEKQSFKLPWETYNLDKSKVDVSYLTSTDLASTVYIGGEEWTKVSSFASSSATDKHYKFISAPFFNNSLNRFETLSERETSSNKENSLILIFGDNIKGLAPPSGSLIEIKLTEERLYPIKKTEHSSELAFPHSNKKDTVSVYRKGNIVSAHSNIISGNTIHRLSNRNVVPTTSKDIVFDDTVTFSNQKIFINGENSPAGELEDPGDWSIDYERGIVFSFSRPTTTSVVSFSYQELKILTEEDWDFGEGSLGNAPVVIKDKEWNTLRGSTVSIDNGATVIHLPHLSVLEGTVKFNNVGELTSFKKEVEFIDGYNELSNFYPTEETIPTLNPTGLTAIFSTLIKMDSERAVFTNTDVFANQVVSLINVVAEGDYFIDLVTSTITVHTDGNTITDPGKITYLIQDNSKVESGIYSVDYKLGIIYLQTAVAGTGVTVDYEYSDYYIKYDIARKVPESDWTYNPSNNSINIGSAEVHNRSNISSIQGSNSFRPTTYLLDYKYIETTRKNISSLAPLFSPILKDYVLQVITSNRL